MTKSTKKALAIAAMGLSMSLVGAQNAWAGPMITDWTITLTNFWANALPNPGVDQTSATHLEWGTSTGEGRSMLDVTGSSLTPTVTTNGPAVMTTNITHTNRPITGLSLSTVDLVSSLTLTQLAPPGSHVEGPVTRVFNINFRETTNTATGCHSGPTNPCDDVFVLLNPFELEADLPFHDGWIYHVSIGGTGVGVLSDGACAAAGFGPGCRGFTTPEGQVTTASTNLAVTARAVPEPGTLAILGLGLAGLTFARRRKMGDVA